ncbi:MAG: histidinol-phosphatase [Acidimicrobiia bacterium]|nr:histidinol-phosphatase [Acidimicrobiia bacterium]
MGDHHVHLHPHGDADYSGPPPGEYPDGHIEAYVERAATNGANEVGFTEHLYRCVESAAALGTWWETDPNRDLADLTAEYVRRERVLSLDKYVDAVLAAKDRGLPVLLGLEVDFFPETIEAVLDLLAPYPFDFLIGSTHWLGAWGIDLASQKYEFDRRGHEQAYEDYFAVETDLASSGTVDVLAHSDVVKKQGVFLETPPIELYDRLAGAAGRSGVAVEVSTAGIHQPAREMYPHPDLLSRMYANGVPVTIASDAHEPAKCGRDRHLAVAFAESVGYTSSVTFRQRERVDVPF